MSIIEINGVDLPAPSSIKIRQSSIDNIEVNELGEELRDNIRSGIYNTSLRFNEINNSELQLILSALDAVILNVKLPTSAGLQIKEMRTNGDIDIDMIKGRDGKAYWNVSFELKEY